MAVLPIGMSGEAGGYQIERSLRFNSADSAYMSRTPASAGNRKTWTWSGWVKRSKLGSEEILFACGSTASDTAFGQIIFGDDNTFRVNAYSLSWRTTTAVYRDVSAWYHFVVVFDTTQATAANRVKVYVNGQEVTAFGTSNNPTQNTDYAINQNIQHTIGRYDLGGGGNYFNGYLTDINFIDGQALTPSSFGETDSDTGVWKPKAYSGSYGTNGFYLKFADNSGTTSTTLGKDSSGNGNNWTPNNFSVTAGAGNDSLVDTPTSYGTDTGAGGEVRGNYCTLNPLDKSQYVGAPTNGNLDVLNSGNFVEDRFVGTVAVNSGKWYFETTITGTYANCQIGIHDALSAASTSTMYRTYSSAGQKLNPSGSSYGSTYTAGDVIGVAFDMGSGKIWFSKNGTWQASGDPAAGTNAAFTDLSGTVTPFVVDYAQATSGTSGHNLNFGQRPFAYTAPSGFKALCTQNLPEPAVVQGDDYFNAVLYTGNGSTNAITGVGFQPDWVWIKERSGAADHGLYDAVRGVQKQLESNTTTAETTETTGLTAFGSDGFTVGALAQLNTNTDTYVAWNWKANGSGVSNTDGSITSTVSANTTAGFSIVTYTGTGSLATVGHGLGVKPAFILTKSRSTTEGWGGYHKSLGASYGIFLELTDAAYAASNYWNNTEPTSTVFTVNVNRTNNGTMVAYCFAEVAGYSAFGSYTGNGSTDGPFIYTGFRPAWVMIKRTNDTSSWNIVDVKRNTYNVMNSYLSANTSSAEDSTYPLIDALSNGFKVRQNLDFINQNTGTFIYACFAESPFRYSLAR